MNLDLWLCYKITLHRNHDSSHVSMFSFANERNEFCGALKLICFHIHINDGVLFYCTKPPQAMWLARGKPASLHHLERKPCSMIAFVWTYISVTGSCLCHSKDLGRSKTSSSFPIRARTFNIPRKRLWLWLRVREINPIYLNKRNKVQTEKGRMVNKW